MSYRDGGGGLVERHRQGSSASKRTPPTPPPKPSRRSKRMSIKNLRKMGIYPVEEKEEDKSDAVKLVDSLSPSSCDESDEDEREGEEDNGTSLGSLAEIEKRRFSKRKQDTNEEGENEEENDLDAEKSFSSSECPTSPAVREAAKRSNFRRKSMSNPAFRNSQNVHEGEFDRIVSRTNSNRASVASSSSSSFTLHDSPATTRSSSGDTRRDSNGSDRNRNSVTAALVAASKDDSKISTTDTATASEDCGGEGGSPLKPKVIKMGRVLKNKRRARDLWKWVNVILTEEYFEYSYKRSLGAMFVGRTKHRFPLKSEFTSVTRDSPSIFALQRPVAAALHFRCKSPEECEEWYGAFQAALRPFRERDLQAKQDLILDDAGNVAGGMGASFETTAPIKMIDLGSMDKKAKYLGNWKSKRVRLDPDASMIELAGISDHIKAARPSNYFVRGGEVIAIQAEGTTTPSFRVSCSKNAKRRSKIDSHVTLRCRSQEQFKKAMMELHAAGAILKGRLIVYGHMKDRISAQIRAEKERRRKELKLPALMGHFVETDESHWDGELLRRFTCYVDLKLTKASAEVRDTPSPSTGNKRTRHSSGGGTESSSSSDDDDDDENEAHDAGVLNDDPAALMRSLHEPLEIGHAMIRTQGGVLSLGSQCRRRIVIEGYMLRVMTPGTGDVATTGGEVENYFVRGSVVHLSDLWENVLLIECWKPPPHQVETRLSLEPEMGLEQTCHILNLLRLREGLLEWRCQLLLNTFRTLHASETAMKRAMDELDQHNRKNATTEAAQNGWVSVASVVDEHEIKAYEQKIKREFNSAEYHEKYFKRAVVKALPQTPSLAEMRSRGGKGRVPAPRTVAPAAPRSLPPSKVATATLDGRRAALPKSVSQPNAAELRKMRNAVESEAGHITDLKSQWQSALKNVPKHARSKLRVNAEYSSSSDLLPHTTSQESLKWLSHMDILDEEEDLQELNDDPPETDKGGSRAKSMNLSKVPRLVAERGDRLNLSGKHAIFVLGPSAAGKTFLTRRNLRRVLSENAFDPQLAFVSVDGGIMRDVSVFWNEMKRLPMQQRVKYMGFSDLFSGYFQKHVGRFKKKVFNNLLAKGANMVIPETAADPFPGIRGRAVDWLRRLRAANYSVVMTCVHASRQSCMMQGKGREVKEGKKYSNVSWSWAMNKVDLLFNFARELGYRRETFFVFDNSDWSKSKVLRVPPHHDLDIRFDYTNDGNSHGRFTCSPMHNIPIARMSTILPEARVVIRVEDDSLGRTKKNAVGVFVESTRKTAASTTLGKALSPLLGSRENVGNAATAKTLTATSRRGPRVADVEATRRTKTSSGFDSLLSSELAAALEDAHQKLSSDGSPTASKIARASDGADRLAGDETTLQLLQASRSVWLVWSSSREHVSELSDGVQDTLFSSGSDRAIISWGTGCSVKRPSENEAKSAGLDDPRRALILLVEISGSAASKTPSAATAAGSSRSLRPNSKRLSSSSVAGASSDALSKGYMLRVLLIFRTSLESLRWQATLEEAVDALRDDAYSRLEIFLEQQVCASENRNVEYKALYAAGEREFGSVFMRLHRNCFLKLYQDVL